MDNPNLLEAHSAWVNNVVTYIYSHPEFSYTPIILQLYSKPAPAGKVAALDKLEVGDSTTFPIFLYSSLCPSIQYRKVRYGKRFKRRVEGELIRVWRLL